MSKLINASYDNFKQPKYEYFGYVYCWFDTKRNKQYIGSHGGKIGDGYITSSKLMMRAFNKRPKTFIFTVLEFNKIDDRKHLYELEQKYLDLIDPKELKQKYYNIKLKASGLDSKTAKKIFEERKKSGEIFFPGSIGFSGGKHTKKSRKQMSNKRKGIKKSKKLD